MLPTAARSTAGPPMRTSTSRSMPRSRSRLAVTGPTPQSASTGSFCRKASTRSGAITVRPSGLRQADAIFARNLLGATPAEAVRPVVFPDQRLDPLRHVHGQRLAPGVLGHVEVRLVERQRLDERRHRPEDREHLLRHRPVLREVRPDDDQVGTEAHGPRHRNGRAHAKRPRLVAGRRHDAARRGRPADRHGPAPQFGPVALLDRRVERVHVDVDDAANRHGQARVSILPMSTTARVSVAILLAVAAGCEPSFCRPPEPLRRRPPRLRHGRGLPERAPPRQHQAAHLRRRERRGVFLVRRQAPELPVVQGASRLRPDLHDDGSTARTVRLRQHGPGPDDVRHFMPDGKTIVYASTHLGGRRVPAGAGPRAGLRLADLRHLRHLPRERRRHRISGG